jgi:hypothetical protein
MFGPPSAKDIKTQYAIEYGANSPRLRISIIAYLLENGMEATNPDFIKTAAELCSFVTQGQADFFTAIDELLPEPEQMDAPSIPEIEGDERNGYNYL